MLSGQVITWCQIQASHSIRSRSHMLIISGAYMLPRQVITWYQVKWSHAIRPDDHLDQAKW